MSPNFSEGRRPEVVDAIVAAITSVPGARRAIISSLDADHNRAVVTFVAPPAAWSGRVPRDREGAS